MTREDIDENWAEVSYADPEWRVSKLGGRDGGSSYSQNTSKTDVLDEELKKFIEEKTSFQFGSNNGMDKFHLLPKAGE